MNTKIIEVTQKGFQFNYGKFMIGAHDTEWDREMRLPVPDSMRVDGPLLAQSGWTKNHVWICDLQTGEAALFRLGPAMARDLQTKHSIWVCSLFQPFLVWLGQQTFADISELPDHVEVPTDVSALHGYRRVRHDDPADSRLD